MGQDQAGMFEPKLTPKQQVKIQWPSPPTLLPGTVATTALLQTLQLLKQFQSRQLRR